jgi:hypothetical protein
MSTAADHTAKAEKLRHRAEECRTLAGLMQTGESTASYLGIADVYDALAEQEEWLARDVVRPSAAAIASAGDAAASAGESEKH